MLYTCFSAGTSLSLTGSCAPACCLSVLTHLSIHPLIFSWWLQMRSISQGTVQVTVQVTNALFLFLSRDLALTTGSCAPEPLPLCAHSPYPSIHPLIFSWWLQMRSISQGTVQVTVQVANALYLFLSKDLALTHRILCP